MMFTLHEYYKLTDRSVNTKNNNDAKGVHVTFVGSAKHCGNRAWKTVELPPLSCVEVNGT